MRQVAPKANPGSDILYYPSTAHNTPPGSHRVTVTHNSADRLILHVPAKRVSILMFAQPTLSSNTPLKPPADPHPPGHSSPDGSGKVWIATPIRLKILRPIVPLEDRIEAPIRCTCRRADTMSFMTRAPERPKGHFVDFDCITSRLGAPRSAMRTIESETPSLAP